MSDDVTIRTPGWVRSFQGTPRTDAVAHDPATSHLDSVVPASFARELEKETQRLRLEVMRLKDELSKAEYRRIGFEAEGLPEHVLPTCEEEELRGPEISVGIQQAGLATDEEMAALRKFMERWKRKHGPAKMSEPEATQVTDEHKRAEE
jgi:hypothetical protein